MDVLATDTRRPLDPAVVSAHVLLPHQVFSAISHQYPKVLATGLGSASGGLRHFWDRAIASDDPHLHAHPLLEKGEGWQDRAIPLTLYGDGARFARVDSLESIAWSFLLSRESTWSKRYVCASFVKSAEWGKDTWRSIWLVLAWSFNAMFDGRHPESDHMGRPWPPGPLGARHAGQLLTREGYFGVIHRVCGDLDWYHKRLELRVAAGANLPCAWCDGGRPPHPPFLHMQPHAQWLSTVHVPPAPVPSAQPIWNISGVSKFTVALDLMHTADLGVYQHFLASCLHTLLCDSGLRGSLSEREAELWGHMRQSYSVERASTRITVLSRSLWCDVQRPHATWPILKTKAAETRCLLKPVLDLCVRYNTGTPRDQARVTAAQHLFRWQTTISGASNFLSDDEHRSAMRSLWGFMQQYHSLSFDAERREVKVFHMVNKFHMLVHLTACAKHMNPILAQTYGFEDLMGRMKRIAVASKSGLKACMVSSSMF